MWTVTKSKYGYTRYQRGPWEIMHWHDDDTVYLWLGTRRSRRVGDDWGQVPEAKAYVKRVMRALEKHFGLVD